MPAFKLPQPCPRPDGSTLDAPKQAVLKQLCAFFEAQKFAWGPIRAHQDEFAQLMNSTSHSDDDIQAWVSEVSLWVRWDNRYGYYLAYSLADMARLRTSRYYGQCLNLRADAQCSVAEDVALDSLEEAYFFLLQNRERFADSFAELAQYHKRRLQLFYDYYHQYAAPFDYIGSLPLTGHLYFQVTALFFGLQFPVIQNSVFTGELDGFDAIIEQCVTPDLNYYRVLAHRHLGIALSKKQNFEEGRKQFLLALELAKEIHLETEIGHLQRLYAYNLRLLQLLPDSREQFRQSCGREMTNDSSTYWTALSFRGLADTLAQTPAWQDDPKLRQLLIDSSYNGRKAFDIHVGLCAIPIARDAKQQLMRAYSERAIRYAALLKRPEDVIGEIEASGPIEATDVALEITAARRSSPATLATYRKNRALYYRTLSTVPADFAAYMENFDGRYRARHAYLYARWLLSADFALSTLSATTVNAVLDLKLPGVYLLLFHVGEFYSTAALVDLTGRHISIETFSFTMSTLSEIHKSYVAAVEDDVTDPSAIEDLLGKYEGLLADYFRGIKPLLKGKHLKIFPRLEMNAVPFHALKIDGEYLIEICDISYGQTLGLFLENHSSQTDSHQKAVRMIVGDKVRWYAWLSSKVKQSFGPAYAEEQQVSWSDLMTSLSAQPARDTVFACHGNFDPAKLDENYLQLAGDTDGKVPFFRVFEDLDLRGCRSVLMGACESGMVRADISAEYIGLPGAMLASGVRYVAGALWTIPQISTTVLVDRYLDLLKDDSNGICAALCAAQREVMRMTRDELSDWIRSIISDNAILKDELAAVADMDARPYARPYFWAGVAVVGDV